MTQEELAARLKVTQSLISIYEKGHTRLPYERAVEAEKILQVRRNTFTNLLGSNTGKHIFVLFGSVQEPWLADLLIALQVAVQGAGLKCEVLASGGNYADEAYRHAQQAIIRDRNSYAGGIVCPPVCIYANWDETSRFIARFGQPLVFVDYHPRFTPRDIPDKVSFIGFDDDYGGYLTAQAILGLRATFAEKKFERLLIVSGHAKYGRFETVKRRVAEGGLQLVVSGQGEFSTERAHKIIWEELRAGLRNGKPIHGVYFPSDTMTVGGLNAIRDIQEGEGWKPCAIFGYDGTELTRFLVQDGTLAGVVEQNCRELADRAVEALVAHIGGQPVGRLQKLVPKYIRPPVTLALA
jgi:DNA-binding LacI/PurR family transcriptional regulator